MNSSEFFDTVTKPGSGSNAGNGTTFGGEFGHRIGTTIGVLILIIVLAITAYVCSRIRAPAEGRSRTSSLPSDSARGHATDFSSVEIMQEVNEQKVEPVQKGSLRSKANTSLLRCSICLTGYKEGDALSSLPGCHHMFHRKCIEPWLKLNPTCPICRSSPITTPISSPIAEMVPLAGRGGQSNR